MLLPARSLSTYCYFDRETQKDSLYGETQLIFFGKNTMLVFLCDMPNISCNLYNVYFKITFEHGFDLNWIAQQLSKSANVKEAK